MIASKPVASMIASAAMLALLTPVHAQRAGSEVQEFLKTRDRWAIKTGADTGAKYIRTDVLQPTKVKKMIPIDRPAELPLKSPGSKATQITRLSDAESKVFVIDADILRYRIDPEDRDISLVIRDHDDTTAEDAAADSGERRTMIAKIPDPALVSTASPWRAAIARVRREFLTAYRPGAAAIDRVVHVKITGIGYFDYMHGQDGFAVNGIELHPVLGIEPVSDSAAAIAPHRARTSTAKASAGDRTVAPDHVGIPLKPIGQPADGQAADVRPGRTTDGPDEAANTASPTRAPALKAHRSRVAAGASHAASVGHGASSSASPHNSRAAVGDGKVWVDLSTGAY